jgi:hypothetical protein
MADIEWKTLPALWPSPAEFADVGIHAERRANMGGPPEGDGEKQRRQFKY